MQTNLEEMMNNHNLACVEAVRDVIHKLATKWGTKVVDILNAEDYQIFTGLYADTLTVHAFIAKNTYPGRAYYFNSEMQTDIQEAFDELPAQLVFDAMTHYGLEDLEQVIRWRIY